MTPNFHRPIKAALFLIFLAPAACSHNSPDASLHQSWFSRTADTTWSALKAPVGWVTPSHKPKPVASTQPEYAPADATIVTRGDPNTPILIMPEQP